MIDLSCLDRLDELHVSDLLLEKLDEEGFRGVFVACQDIAQLSEMRRVA